MVFNNLAFFTPFGFFGHGLAFFLKRYLATLAAYGASPFAGHLVKVNEYWLFLL